MSRHSRAWHRMHDAALAEAAELQALHMPAFIVLSDADREKLKRCGSASLSLIPVSTVVDVTPPGLAENVGSYLDGLQGIDRHARRAARAAYGHQTGSYDD